VAANPHTQPTPPPTLIGPAADDALGDALRRALADEPDPAVRKWLKQLLAGDELPPTPGNRPRQARKQSKRRRAAK